MPIAIRPMTRRDVVETTRVVRDGGWSDRRRWFEFVVDHPACSPYVAVDGREILGVGVATRNGPVGWVGTVFVTPDRRRTGLGRALTETVCDRLESDGCRTLVLVASDLGRPVYERLGFEVQGWYRISESTGTGAGRRGPGIATFRPADVDEAAALDRIATGEDRRHLLDRFANTPGGLALRRPDASLAGFLVRAIWGGAATIALEADDGQRLLEARRSEAQAGHVIRAGVLESNAAGMERLAADGWSDAWRIVRMARGAPLDWRPQAIWGQFSFATG